MQNGLSIMRYLPRQQALKLFKSAFVRDVSVLMSGTAIAQVLTIAVAPILSRLYDPNAFGAFALFTSVLSILSVIAAWCYEYAIILPGDEEEAANVLAVAFLAVIIMTGLSAILIGVAGKWIAVRLGSPELRPWLWWLPVSILMIGFYNSLNYWSTRRQHFKRLSISRIFRSVASAGAQTSAGFANAGALGLISGQVAGQIIATATLGYQVWGDDRRLIRQALRLSKMKELARKYVDFPKYSSLQNLLNAVAQNVAPFLLAYYFSSMAVGLYAISLRFLQLPATLLGQSVRQVFFQRASEAQRNGNVFPLLTKATISLFAIGIIPTLVLMLFAPPIFSFVLGKAWYKAGIYAQFMVVWLFFSLVDRPSVTLIPILNLQSFHAIFEFVFLLLRIAAIWLGAYLGNDIIAIGGYSIMGVFFHLSLLLYVMRCSYIHDRVPEKRRSYA